MRSLNLSLLGLLAAGSLLSSSALAADLAAPGLGLTQWQWACQSDTAILKASGSASFRDASAPSRDASPAPAPAFDPSFIERALPARPNETRLVFKEGSSWRGVPVSGFVHRATASGLVSYFISPLPPLELSERLVAGSPFSSASAKLSPARRSLNPAETQALLTPLSSRSPSTRSASESWVGCFGGSPDGVVPAIRVQAAPS